jgi:hypothetical protein
MSRWGLIGLGAAALGILAAAERPAKSGRRAVPHARGQGGLRPRQALLPARGSRLSSTGADALAVARSAVPRATKAVTPGQQPPFVLAARRLNRAAGLLASSVLADSAVEHYRGSFQNPAMFAPLVTSALALGVSAHGVSDRRPGAHAVRDTVYALAGMTGLVGTGFHIYNVGKRPGGFSWLNLFYSAPLGAPFALVLSGLLGFTAERVRDNRANVTPTMLGLPAGRAMAAVSSMGMLGTTGEAALLHFRGAFHDPAMFLPVTVPPMAAVLLADTALGRRNTDRRFTRWWMRLTAALGFAGVGFHIFGVARNMGGWRNWSQNVLNGPPIPAPPSFTGLALAGLAALGLLQDHPDA